MPDEDEIDFLADLESEIAKGENAEEEEMLFCRDCKKTLPAYHYSKHARRSKVCNACMRIRNNDATRRKRERDRGLNEAVARVDGGTKPTTSWQAMREGGKKHKAIREAQQKAMAEKKAKLRPTGEKPPGPTLARKRPLPNFFGILGSAMPESPAPGTSSAH